MKPKIEFSDAELQKAFTEMSPKTFRTAVKAGMRRSLNIIKKKAVANYKSAYPGSDRYKYIHAKVYRTGTGAMIDLLFLKGNKEVRPYVLKFQNAGSNERGTKSGYYRGVMPASHFFSEAVESTKGQAQNELMRNVNEAIVKKARKLADMIIEKPLRIGTEISRLLSTSPKVVSIVGKHIYPYLTQMEVRKPHIVYDAVGVTFEQTKDGEYPSEIALTLNCNTTDYNLGIELGEAVIDVFEDHEDIAVTYANCEYDSGSNMFTHAITINIVTE